MFIDVFVFLAIDTARKTGIRNLDHYFFAPFSEFKLLNLGLNQSFDELSIGGIPIVYNFASPLATKILCLNRDGVIGIKL